MQFTKRTLLVLAFVSMSFRTANARDAVKDNDTLLEASSPFEDMVEFALAGDDSGLTKSLKAADDGADAVREVLPAAAKSKFSSLLQAIHKAAAAKKHHAVAMNAVEVFHLLIDNLSAASLTVPKEVSLLDYAGFKLHVLAAAPQSDWKAIRQTVDDAVKWWAAIKSKVSDKALRDAFNTTVGGLQEADKVENLRMLNFAAQIDLDLVDLLEGQFEHAK